MTIARIALAALVLVLAAAGSPRAQPLDAASAEALAATLRMLQDPALRNPAIARDPKAGAIDRQLQSLAGSEKLTQELYELAAEIFNDLARGSGGDLGRMNEALERGRSDPAGFAALLSPRTLERLRELAVKISDRRR